MNSRMRAISQRVTGFRPGEAVFAAVLPTAALTAWQPLARSTAFSRSSAPTS
ncbi:hypothetical protein [Streptomyces sp. ME19-01-6]|uniref:hypothetical protein n=1 Tax=Streptomyces sp. ME19-01-6 TaxID=3028686 RepID=UPI0029A3EE07|nr:hypothetical protein [Streptomyces sp. ME19-01-6]MDX3227527.1 hypothetical protein [Streptomyces sp. ME19-01-6]